MSQNAMSDRLDIETWVDEEWDSKDGLPEEVMSASPRNSSAAEDDLWWEREPWFLYPEEPNTDAIQRRVLIVEDDPFTVKLLSRIIHNIYPDIKVESVPSSEEAQQMLLDAKNDGEDHPYDLFITDIFLEGEQTGLDVMHLAKRLYPDLPVIITSIAPEDKYQKMLELDDFSPPFLHKPFSPDDCQQVIWGMLETNGRYT